ncbi:MAG: phage portal protein [Gammaproteobacteria bacterium]|nr:phage portal protein [Gammaproteobacteria bacterium]
MRSEAPIKTNIIYDTKNIGSTRSSYDFFFNGFSNHNTLELGTRDYFRTQRTLITAYTALPFVYACVSSIADDIGSRRFYFVDHKGNEIDDTRLPRDISNRIRVRSGNAFPFKELLKSMVVNFEVTGNALVRIDEDCFVEVPPHSYTILSDYYGDYFRGYSTHKGILYEDDVIHVKKTAPYNRFRGIGAIEASSLQLSTEFKSDATTNIFFNNAGIPSYVIVVPDYSAKESKRISQTAKENTTGRHIGEPLVVDSDAKIHTLQSSHKDMQFLEMKEFNLNTVCALFKVPRDVLGIPDSSNRATSMVSQDLFKSKKNTVMTTIEDAINNQFFYKYFERTGISFKLDKYVISDQEKVLQLLNEQMITYDQCATMIGIEAMESRPYYKEPIQPYFPTSPAEKPKQYNVGMKNTEGEEKCDIDNATSLRARIRKQNGAKPHQLKFFDRQIKSRIRLQKDTLRGMQGFFESQGKRFLDFFNKNTKSFNSKNIDISSILLAFFSSTEDSILRDTLRDFHYLAISVGIQDINYLMNGTVDFGLNKVEGLMDRIGSQVVRINETTRMNIRDIVVDGINDNLDITQIADNIKGHIDNYYYGRAMTIARTETRIAIDEGNKVAFKELGVKMFDVVGCSDKATEHGGTEPHGSGYCNVKNIPHDQINEIFFHINHIGAIVPSHDN